MSDIVTVCQVLNSYFLHEISSPLSAISSTTDLFNSSQPKIKKEAFNIISDGANILYNKVKFYSYAYSISGAKQNISLETIKKLCEGILIKAKIELLIIDKLSNGFLEGDLGKIIMCLIITAQKSLFKEGKIIVEVWNENIKIKILGNLMPMFKDKVQILFGEIDDFQIDVFNCNEYYARLLAERSQYKIVFTQRLEQIEYIIGKQ